MEISSQTEGTHVLVINLREDNLDASNVAEFKETVLALIQPYAHVVLDLTGVKFIDSSGLGAMILCLRQLNARQGDIRLCNLSVTVLALFELMRMNRVFNIHSSREAAVASFG
ncbi:MAG: anti-sigma factor antagonist [Variovorax sp.]|jgi:anti-sigma B factor antagonist|nr:MAG: anti-sigma factor antagonist [Variovorax sp.]